MFILQMVVNHSQYHYIVKPISYSIRIHIGKVNKKYCHALAISILILHLLPHRYSPLRMEKLVLSNLKTCAITCKQRNLNLHINFLYYCYVPCKLLRRATQNIRGKYRHDRLKIEISLWDFLSIFNS